ncbi:MAG: PH domain-containing protein [Solirubrobacterales bacterium]|nr:PH domain-containing protein [Solirubrobacterales bacterium]
MRPEPTQRLAGVARGYWALQGAAAGLAAFVLSEVVGDDLGDTAATLLPLAALLVLVVGVAVVPALRWRRWRWEVRDVEVDLRHGLLTEVRTIVPMSRVQHVEVQRSLLGQLFGVSTVAVHTAAGEVEIPALPEAAAALVRDRIADLAQEPDDL